MCGIFGISSTEPINKYHLLSLAAHARQRGRDSSGFLKTENNICHVRKADIDILRLIKSSSLANANLVAGHSRLVTSGLTDNQPVIRDGVALLHNGIITNEAEIWASVNITRQLTIDSEAIIAVALHAQQEGADINKIPSEILARCKGTISAAIYFSKEGKLCLLSNNGSLYIGSKDQATYFSSEKYPLAKLGCLNIIQIQGSSIILDVPSVDGFDIQASNSRKTNLIPPLVSSSSEEKLLVYNTHHLQRCSKCILPETMPFIRFDSNGVCNYCNGYVKRNKPKPKDEFLDILSRYRRIDEPDCIIPFSGGRDSCWGLHLAVNELNLKPITYTYDWGMITDLGRRNISRMCSKLGVENVIVAADIEKKRRNIALNLKAWLKHPSLSMISILTAGDKHFFRHIETVKKQTGINLNLWGVNPLEVTHFKAGFLGVAPDFKEKRVYMHGIGKQLDYQARRFQEMLKSPGYFNLSLWDTLSGEYFRSFTEKSDYYHIFDYWKWDEDKCNEVLSIYDWELAPDTSTSWRIGDGTAAFYNYIYYTVAGFTEHDTFRSNQIREGDIQRDRALQLVKSENRPRYQNIKWYLDAIGFDFRDTISHINNIPRFYD
jgi:hypothetical protein